MAHASLDDWERTVERYGRASPDRTASTLLENLSVDLAELKRPVRGFGSRAFSRAAPQPGSMSTGHRARGGVAVGHRGGAGTNASSRCCAVATGQPRRAGPGRLRSSRSWSGHIGRWHSRSRALADIEALAGQVDDRGGPAGALSLGASRRGARLCLTPRACTYLDARRGDQQATVERDHRPVITTTLPDDVAEYGRGRCVPVSGPSCAPMWKR
jgi:hypothetical protein